MSKSLFQIQLNEKNQFEIESNLQEKDDIPLFFQKLKIKELTPKQINGKRFFKTPFDLFSNLFNNSKGDPSKIKRDLISFVLGFPNWGTILPELEFLTNHQFIMLHFIRNSESVVFFGLTLILLSILYNVKLKVYQLYQNKSLMTFELANNLETHTTFKIAAILVQNGISLSILEKSKFIDESRDFKELSEELNQERTKINFELSNIEVQISKILTTNLGVCFNFTFNSSELVSNLNMIQENRHEIEDILGIIHNLFSGKKAGKQNKKHLKIEKLGICYLSSDVKKDLIFGKKGLQDLKMNNVQTNSSIKNGPPGLMGGYFDCLQTSFGGENIQKSDIELEEINKNFKMNKLVNNHNQPGFKSSSPQQKTQEELLLSRTGVQEDNLTERFTGYVKFVNESGKYGFFVKEVDNTDVFFHFSELEKSKINLKMLISNKNSRVSFAEVKYIGKHSISKKAVEILLM